MPYIGRGVTNTGAVSYLDDIASGFDGSETDFTMQVGSVNITPDQENIHVYLDGVFQHPGSGNAYTTSGATIAFTAAPVANTVFTAYVAGEQAYLEDTTVTSSKIADDAVTPAKLDDDGTGFQVGDLGVGGSLTSGDKLTVTGRARVSGGIIGDLTGDVTGNADTATVLATTRAINGVNFNGSAAITVTAAAGTLSGSTLASGVTASSLTSLGDLTALTVVGNITMDKDGQAILKVESNDDAAELRLRSYYSGSARQWSLFSDNAQDAFIINDGTTRFTLTDTSATFANDVQIDGDLTVSKDGGGHGIFKISSDANEGADSGIDFQSGTTSRGSIYYDHHTTAATQKMVFKTGDNAVTAMTVLGDGKVGIGCIPDVNLHVNSDSGSGYIYLTSGGNNAAIMHMTANKNSSANWCTISAGTNGDLMLGASGSGTNTDLVVKNDNSVSIANALAVGGAVTINGGGDCLFLNGGNPAITMTAASNDYPMIKFRPDNAHGSKLWTLYTHKDSPYVMGFQNAVGLALTLDGTNHKATFAGAVSITKSSAGTNFSIGGYNGRAIDFYSPGADRQFYFGLNTSAANYIAAHSLGGGNMYFGVGLSPAQYTLDVAGNIGYSGSITDYSLRSTKKDIVEIDGVGMIEKVKKLPLYKYNLKTEPMALKAEDEVYKRSKGRYGLIADDEVNLEEFPELINWGQHEDEDEPRIVGIDTTAYIGVLHGAIKELISKVEALENA